jgi:hypothetical protein
VVSNSGSLLSWSLYAEIAPLIAREIYYSDSDNDKKIDTLEIIYPYALTWVVNTGAIFLYSNTGGLSSMRINTFSGYILSGTLSGNILIFHMLEWDIEKTTLKTGNTTASELRLKSSWDLGFRSIGWQVPEDFFLTSSFDSYKKVYKREVVIGIDQTGSGNSHSWMILIYTGETLSGSTSTIWSFSGTSTGVVFPPIFMTLQEPSNATYSWEILDCTGRDPCRININFLPIFTGWYLEKNYICEVTTSTDMRISCNPDTFYFSTWDTLTLTIKSKINPEIFVKKEWQILSRTISTETISWSTNTGMISLIGNEILKEIIVFPDIIPNLQSPTNATFSWEIFTCTSIDCRINLILESIFASGFLMRDFSCYFATGAQMILDSDCNPMTFYYTSSGTLDIELISKKDINQKSRKIYPVEWKIVSSNPSSKPSANIPINPSPQDTTKPIARLKIDGKWKEYYEQIGDYEMDCYTSTCSLNWTAEESYDPEGSAIRFLWIYGPNDISTSKDPGTRKYTIGDHTLILRVIDSAWNYDEIRYIIHVLGPRSKEEKPKKIKSEKIQKIESKIAGLTTKKKKPKKIKMAFFSPPTLILQGKSGKKISDVRYTCISKRANTCSLNFALSGALKWYDYIWKIDTKEIGKWKNPTAWKLSPGNHTIRVNSYMKWWEESIDELSFSVYVSAEPKKPKKAKKPKKIKTPKKLKKVKIWSLVDSTYADANDKNNAPVAEAMNIWFLIFGWWILLGYILRRRKKI